ncbi:2-oxoacid dehydrogenases acyltransferase (catalytic domain) [Legionella massiliensis]|uniref:2-oxoacid dehydrogenases acyltransferase (Catalytic domain) n=1 Tax=Legionella massiliensis TaxID=1034943 RepID=A0A078KXN5_9GAMM|nr:2-oxo acid dehydrogenase subunit E2 [Legionella massiliensis]CDZ77736.1 2-oxoacid dehydrogenases acyltransferase (catalytic domain) [Legionella massiliensis]CEE13474.1 2-oxoacid dehydrogenases acyltransferase (catalytic domain) [Legionella massiliensis]
MSIMVRGLALYFKVGIHTFLGIAYFALGLEQLHKNLQTLSFSRIIVRLLKSWRACMIQLQELIKPTWFAEEWLNNAWSVLEVDEQLYIKNRVDEMFYNEIPFQLEHDRIVYIHLFALLAQLEILAFQGFLKSLEKMAGTPLYATMRKQVVDEIFHSLVFTKITNQLSTPYASPPNYHKEVEQLMQFLASEPDLNTFLILINLVSESWIEEIFSCMKEHNIASNIFEVILADESRHIEISDHYFQSELKDKSYLSKRIASLEEELVKLIFSQEKFVITFVSLLGKNGVINFINRIDNKHRASLKKVGLSPSNKWRFFMETIHSLVENVFHEQSHDSLVTKTNTRSLFNSLWDNPNNPTLIGFFSLNISSLDFFEKKHKPEIFTCLYLQAISKLAANNQTLRSYMSNHKIYSTRNSYVGLTVLLPGCDDQLGLIEFEDCHEMSIAELAQSIKDDIKLMTYCYKKMHELKTEHPYLEDVFSNLFTPLSESIYRDPIFAKPTISLSNVGYWGYEAGVSPLLPHEALKFTLAKIERKQVWNNKTRSFEVQDLLPVGISADHRIMDANIPVPEQLQEAFDAMVAVMNQSPPVALSLSQSVQFDDFIRSTNEMLDKDLEFGYRYLYYASQVWKHGKTQEVFKKQAAKSAVDFA